MNIAWALPIISSLITRTVLLGSKSAFSAKFYVPMIETPDEEIIKWEGKRLKKYHIFGALFHGV